MNSKWQPMPLKVIVYLPYYDCLDFFNALQTEIGLPIFLLGSLTFLMVLLKSFSFFET